MTNRLQLRVGHTPSHHEHFALSLLSSRLDQFPPLPAAADATYSAHGALSSLSLGRANATVQETQTFNSRLQLTSLTRPGFGFTYSYCPGGADSCSTNNGNPLQQTITHANSAAQVYGYDGVGRLYSVQESGAWSRTYDFDQYGNHWVPATTGLSVSALTPIALSAFNAKNQLTIQGAAYDAAGYQTAIGGLTQSYDGEGRLAQSTANAVSTTYAYDGEGRRVKKQTQDRTTLFVYGVSGNLIQEYDTKAPDETEVRFPMQDHLGSTRVVFNATGTAVHCLDYTPYGEQLPRNLGPGRTAACWDSAEDPKMKFTGKERDSETGLDYFLARYYSPAQGRFASPDPIVHPAQSEVGMEVYLSDPLRWNKYTYVSDNPLKYVDPNGAEQAVGCVRGICYNNLTGQVIKRQSTSDMLRTAAIPVAGMTAAAGGGWLASTFLGRVATAAYLWLSTPSGQRTAATVADIISPPGSSSASMIGLPIKTTEESFQAALKNGPEFVNGFRIDGAKQLIGGVFDRNIFAIASEGKSSMKALGGLVSSLEAEAKSVGADVLRITGNAIHNSGSFNARVAARYGFEFKQIDGETVELVKGLK